MNEDKLLKNIIIWLDYTDHNSSDLCRSIDLTSFEESLWSTVGPGLPKLPNAESFSKVINEINDFYKKHKNIVVDESTRNRIIAILKVFVPHEIWSN